MSKKCVSCDNDILYEDGIAKCPQCGNFLRLVDPYEVFHQSSVDTNDSNIHSDPYASIYDHQANKCEKVTLNDNEINLPESGTKTDYSSKEIVCETRGQTSSDQDTGPHSAKKEKKFISSKGSQEPICEGIVKNFYEQEIHTFFVTKIYRSLFKGLPFVYDNTVNTFQVFTGWGIEAGDNNSSEEIILYGKIAKGKMPENNIVKVWGKRDQNGSIIASKIKNETSQTLIHVNHAISPIVVWFLVAFLSYIIYQITQINWGGVFAYFMNILEMIIFAVFIVFIAIIIPFRSIFRKK